ncbi:hypothetical protein BDV98DRAFT_601529 [Pterulicium gracile]|uniref:Thaumatin n=1 Tax=Pterulicium gracile TaxID=1884261 RepID=A0A5C3QXJ2_9AGAR|nr:hypothetical protein BDV98DRAFT_601529 [Pterula gracilis]
MQLLSLLTAGLVALTSVLPAVADHELRFKNNCGFNVTPKWKAGSGGLSSGPSMARGAQWSGWVPEYWVAGRVYGQNGACLEPDGARCTLFECTFNNIGYNQCNISRVSGYNIGMSFSWIGGSGCQGGKNCNNPNCGNNVAWLPPDSCNGCLSQCNTARVGMLVTFCP